MFIFPNRIDDVIKCCGWCYKFTEGIERWINLCLYVPKESMTSLNKFFVLVGFTSLLKVLNRKLNDYHFDPRKLTPIHILVNPWWNWSSQNHKPCPLKVQKETFISFIFKQNFYVGVQVIKNFYITFCSRNKASPKRNPIHWWKINVKVIRIM